MPEYHAPGVYVEETSFRSRNIEGVPTHSTALLGITGNGPQGIPTQVTSFRHYLQHFGGSRGEGAATAVRSQQLSDAVRGFFDNGGRRLYVVAVASADEIPTALTTLDSITSGSAAGSDTETDTDGDTVTDTDGGPGANQPFDYISLIAAPGFTDEATQQALITHCEQARYRFAILDAVANSDIQQVRAQRQRYDSKRAALYYPWLEVAGESGRRGDADSLDADGPDATRTVPPSGHIAGLYARVDVDRGVHKAPANEVLRGVVGLERSINQAQHEVLNPEGINVIRDIRGQHRGIRVWGARTMSSDPEWKYVNVPRLFNYLEHSIERGTGWAVFETNGEPLWNAVRRTVEDFLTGLWRQGALMGRTTEEAFFVRCDRTTMTQADLDNGRLICLIGIAPVKPAEFVIFRIGQLITHTD